MVTKIVACIASISVRFWSKERPRKENCWFWPREKWNKSQKLKEGEGGEEGRKRLQTNPSILKTCVRQQTRLIGLASRIILTWVDQRFVSYWEVMYGMWHTYINFLWLLFILVSKICPPMQEHCLTSFEMQSSSCNYVRTSDRLISSPKCLLDLNN